MEAVYKVFGIDENLMKLNLKLNKLRKVMKMSFDEAVLLCKSEPEEELRFIGCPAGFEELEDDFRVDGSTFRVQIF